jgi:hypothetical protein
VRADDEAAASSAGMEASHRQFRNDNRGGGLRFGLGTVFGDKRRLDRRPAISFRMTLELPAELYGEFSGEFWDELAI